MLGGVVLTSSAASCWAPSPCPEKGPGLELGAHLARLLRPRLDRHAARRRPADDPDLFGSGKRPERDIAGRSPGSPPSGGWPAWATAWPSSSPGITPSPTPSSRLNNAIGSILPISRLHSGEASYRRRLGVTAGADDDHRDRALCPAPAISGPGPPAGGRATGGPRRIQEKASSSALVAGVLGAAFNFA